MAQKPDGKPARTERVTFTRPAAERIAKVVRTVEGGDRDTGPLTFGNRGVGGVSGKVFRIATYTGAWSIGDTKTVSFKYQTATPNTVSATNLFFPITNTATASARDCAIAKDGTAWFLIDVKLAQKTAVFATEILNGILATEVQNGTRVTDVNISASLNSANCTITIGKTLVTAATVFVSGTATGVVAKSTFSANYLTIDQ